jgi:MerR family mercuric resistance operon transcriptional regulator
VKKYSISRLAQESGVSLQAVRYYERQGLLAPMARTEAGYRIFQPETARRIRFIKRAQEVGFSLTEIKELLSLRADGHTTQAEIRKRAEAKLSDVALKIRHLEVIHASLSLLTKSCGGCGAVDDCPILENLDGKEFL